MLSNRIRTLACLGSIVIITTAGCTREITTVVSETPEPASCFECHSDQNTQLVAIERQWENSLHASGLNSSRSSASCSGCHTSEGFLQRVAGEETTNINNPTMIHCFTCHAPHTDQNFELRVDEPQMLADGTVVDIGKGNLCASCHQSRRDFDAYFSGNINSPYWGPHHGTQTDLLYAANAHEFDGFDYQETEWHRTLTEDACVQCHVRTSGQNWVVGGHSFNMRAMVDGVDGEDPDEFIITDSCKECHADFGRDFDYRGAQTEIDNLVNELNALLVTAGLLDATGHPIPGDTITKDTAGALWNYLIVIEDRSRGIHNPRYAKGLLQSSIDFLSTPAN
ncbi:MAG: hypothetical protein ACI9UK_000460 [Candidatus Krumholzibacteriia bacterium]|jgi:formate-dependent nitrite reductase cytochrome c552 subunit